MRTFILIHPHSRKYLRFAFENKVYQFRVLHFSLNTAPQVFTCLRHRVAAYRISSQKTLSYRGVPIYGITQLGLRSHPTGSSTVEALTTLSFIRSDKPVFNTPAFRPCSPCYPTQAVAEPIVSHIRNPYLTFPGRVHHFHRRPHPGLGRSHGGFSDCGCMDPFRTGVPHQCTGAQGGNIGPQSLGYSITGSSCFDCYRQLNKKHTSNKIK